jgi:hypothetical protein
MAQDKGKVVILGPEQIRHIRCPAINTFIFSSQLAPTSALVLSPCHVPADEQAPQNFRYVKYVAMLPLSQDLL